MTPTSVHDKEEIARLLGRDPQLHAYELGDLDGFYWPYTTWYRHGETVALVYHGAGFPVVLAFARPDRVAAVVELLDGLLFLLPQRFYAHVSAGTEHVLARRANIEPGGLHLKMALTDRERPMRYEPVGEPLTRVHEAELNELYRIGYPGNWFDARMLDTGQYLGVWQEGELVAVAGVHVWSPDYKVCALGNVTTHPRVRGTGMAKAVVAALCRQLLDTVDHVTLNVKADNAAAIAVYRTLGFTQVAEYHELWAEIR